MLRDEIEEYLEARSLGGRTAAATLSAYRHDLTALSQEAARQGRERACDLDAGFLQTYFSQRMADGASRRTTEREMASARGFFRYLRREGRLEENPAQGLRIADVIPERGKAAGNSDAGIPGEESGGRRRKETEPDAVSGNGFAGLSGERSGAAGREGQEMRVLSREELLKLMEQPSSGTWNGLRDRAILELLYAAGLKASELTALRIRDVDLQISCVVMETAQGTERVIPFGAGARKALMVYLRQVRARFLTVSGEDSPEEEAILFVNDKGQALSRQALWQLVRKYAVQAGLGDQISPTTLRHTLACHLLQNGADLESVQEILGHTAIQTTKQYEAYAENRLRTVYNAALQKQERRRST
ncbi:MAG: tyrosine-type recombinase/integrase [Eubacteriales bacterium]|nr:tyrosine-type recombinase/integrase [Eubacteriales bacterium]